MENLQEKQRTTRLYDELIASMKSIPGSRKNYDAQEVVHAAKQELASAMEKLKDGEELSPHHKRLNKAMAELNKKGNLAHSSSISPADIFGAHSHDTTAKKGIKDNKKTKSKPNDVQPENRGTRPPEGRVEKLAAARPEAEKNETPLENIKDDTDPYLQVASTYLEMIAEQEQNNLVAQILQEMENMLEEAFSDEEYKKMYDYVRSYLNEGTFRAVRRTGPRNIPNMAGDYKGTKPGNPNTKPLTPEEMAALGILTGKGAIHNRKESDDFSKYFERTQREKNKGNQQ